MPVPRFVRPSRDFVCYSPQAMCKNHEPMKITTSALSLLAAIVLNSCATQARQPGNFGCQGTDSPDHQLRACVVEVGKFPPPLNESRVDIRDTSGKVVASRSFGSPKGDQGRSVVHSAWTPDSNFFVFSTLSSGGHSPWHWNTYFYSRKKNSFALLDDTIGPVIKPNFAVKAPDVVEATVQGTASDPTDIKTGHVVSKHLGTL
jgi:hypothetical protein